MKCDEKGCERNACRMFGSEWIVCREHLKKYHPHLFDEWEDELSDISSKATSVFEGENHPEREKVSPEQRKRAKTRGVNHV